MHRDDVTVGVGESERAPDRPVNGAVIMVTPRLARSLCKASMPPSAFSHSATPQPSRGAASGPRWPHGRRTEPAGGEHDCPGRRGGRAAEPGAAQLETRRSFQVSHLECDEIGSGNGHDHDLLSMSGILILKRLYQVA